MRKLLGLIFFISSLGSAQVTEAIPALLGDLQYLGGEYVTPAAEAAVYQSSSGWYTSAKVKKLWDVEFSLQGNLLFINSKHAQFLIDEANLNNIYIPGEATTAYTPTALGGDDSIVLMGDTNGAEDGGQFEFDSPEGLDEPNVKHAQIQAALGLWKGTSVIVRYSPKIKINKTYYQVLGFGAQHNLTQWFAKDSLSTFNVAALATYSFYSVSDNFTEVKIPVGNSISRLNAIVVDGQSFVFNLIASKEIKKFTFSTSVGLTSSSFSYTMGGEGILLDPLNETLKGLSDSKQLFKADFGIDYRFGRFSANSMFTIGKYSNLVVGLNFNL